MQKQVLDVDSFYINSKVAKLAPHSLNQLNNDICRAVHNIQFEVINRLVFLSHAHDWLKRTYLLFPRGLVSS